MFFRYIVCGVLFFCAAEEEAEDGEGTIDEEDFEAEFVACEEFDWEAVDEYGGDDWDSSDEGHEAVADVPFGEHAYNEESEQWAIGVACEFEYGVDYAIVVEGIE